MIGKILFVVFLAGLVGISACASMDQAGSQSPPVDIATAGMQTEGPGLDEPAQSEALGSPADSDGPSAEEIAKKSANPLSDLWMLWFQNDFSRFGGDLVDGGEYLNSTKFQPVMSFPIFDGDWNLIVRPVFQFQSVPLDEDVGDLIGLTGEEIVSDSDLASVALDPFDGRTTGLGDTALLTLLGPNREDGFVWGVGVTQLFPTAGEDVLGSGKYAIGPALLLARFAPNVGGFNLGILAQHWWSYAGDDDRADVNLTDIQYFINYRLSATELIGMAPNIKINWEEDDSDDRVTFPIGMGYSNLYFLGKLPIRVAAEIQYSVIKSDKIGPEWNLRILFIPIVPNLFKLLTGKS